MPPARCWGMPGRILLGHRCLGALQPLNFYTKYIPAFSHGNGTESDCGLLQTGSGWSLPGCGPGSWCLLPILRPHPLRSRRSFVSLFLPYLGPLCWLSGPLSLSKSHGGSDPPLYSCSESDLDLVLWTLKDWAPWHSLYQWPSLEV